MLAPAQGQAAAQLTFGTLLPKYFLVAQPPVVTQPSVAVKGLKWCEWQNTDSTVQGSIGSAVWSS
jgi:hypothetical protein